MRRSWFAVVLGAVLLAACGSPASSSGTPSAPGAPATSAPATGVAPVLTCDGGIVFAAAALDAPPGAEAGAGGEFDALRDALSRDGSAPGGYLPAVGWRLVARDGSSVLFLARALDGDDPPWRQVTVDVRDGRWQAGGTGGCDLRVVLGPGIGAASWSLDPAFAPPAPADTRFHVQVWERACASGEPAVGRVAGPAIVYDPDTVTVTYGVRPKPGAQECPSNPPTPVLLELAEPLGDRVLLDGGSFPPVPPSPAF